MKSNEQSYNGRIVTVVEKKGGWTTILDGMKQLKVRNSELTAPVAGKANVPAKKSATPKPAAKATKSARKATKSAKPANGADDSRLVKPDLSRYNIDSEIRTSSGRKAVDIGDDVASELRGADLSEVYKVASGVTGQSRKALESRYEHLNPGMQRMNLGNLIRGARAAEARAAAKA